MQKNIIEGSKFTYILFIYSYFKESPFVRHAASGRIVSSPDTKNNFLSAIKSTRYSEKDGKKFVEYEVSSMLRVAGVKVQQDDVYQWSVWKRYSEFESLHASMKSSLGWQMDPVGDLPPSHRFVLNKLAPAFVDQRRDDLRVYWQKLVNVDKVTDFTKHHCSKALKDFLEVDEQMHQVLN